MFLEVFLRISLCSLDFVVLTEALWSGGKTCWLSGPGDMLAVGAGDMMYFHPVSRSNSCPLLLPGLGVVAALAARVWPSTL